MKKISLIIISLLILLALTSCVMTNVSEFEHDGATYYYENSDGIKTVTNYHPYKFWSLPNYQEMIQFGDGAGLENDGVVYFIYAVDTSIDSDSPKAYYTAELDGETKELLFEEGEYFVNEADKNDFINRLLDVLDAAE